MADYDIDSLKREARSLEMHLENLLDTFSRACRGSADTDTDEESGYSYGESMSLYQDIDAKLGQFQDVLDRMGDKESTFRTTERAMFQRYRQVYADFVKESRSLRRQAERQKESEDLFKGIEWVVLKGEEPLLRERSAIQGAGRAIDAVLGQAAEARIALANQRKSLLASASRAGQATMQLPGISKLIGVIDRTRTRRSLIIGGVISLCVVFMLWWMLW